MKTRIIDENGNIVWFGSYGKNDDGTGKFINKDTKRSYVDKNEGIKCSLIQRLSVIKGELWYNIDLGIPLFEKQRNKGVVDSYIISTVLEHPDVISITEFNSYIVNNHNYECDFKCTTKYGEIEVSL